MLVMAHWLWYVGSGMLVMAGELWHVGGGIYVMADAVAEGCLGLVLLDLCDERRDERHEEHRLIVGVRDDEQPHLARTTYSLWHVSYGVLVMAY